MYLMRLLNVGLSGSIYCRLTRGLTSLPHRSVLELRGPDAGTFLQGLTTVDVINPTRLAQYSALLNVQGRLLYDVIIYHVGHGRLWLESDRSACDQILRHFKRYVLRAKVEFELLNDVSVCSRLASQSMVGDHIIGITDPRTSVLGERVLVKDRMLRDGIDQYHQVRLECGVPEGVEEMPPGHCLPLEMNLDYMNGVSFTKGCYLGQELTSRTHHTGVIRKRVVPLLLETRDSDLHWGMPVTNTIFKAVGKVLGWHDKHVIALLRLPNLVEGEKLKILSEGGNTLTADWAKPQWWPK